MPRTTPAQMDSFEKRFNSLSGLTIKEFIKDCMFKRKLNYDQTQKEMNIPMSYLRYYCEKYDIEPFKPRPMIVIKNPWVTKLLVGKTDDK